MDNDPVAPEGDAVLLYGDIGQSLWSGDGITAKSVASMLAGRGDVIFRLNSGGGDAFEGAAIHAVLAAHPGRVVVHVDGIAASAASLLAMAADEIVMSAGALMMVHDPSGMTIGPAAAHERTAQTLEKIADNYAHVYAKRTGKTDEEMRAVMLAETWMTAAEAVEMGFADREDEIEEARPVAAFPYDVYARSPECLRSRAKTEGWALPETAAHAAPIAQKGVSMSTKLETAENAVKPEMTGTEKPAEKVDAQKLVMAERARAKGIRDAVMALNLDANLADTLIDEGVSLDVARARIIDAKAEVGDKHEYTPRASVIEDGRDRFAEGASRAIMARAGMAGGERNEFTGMTLLEMARASMEQAGHRVRATSKMDVASEAFGVRMTAQHTTSDFTSILENIANKSMLRGFDEQEETFQLWTSRGSLPDFKQAKRVGMSLFPTLPKMTEGAEYTYATLDDYAEPVALATYGRMFSITRETIINDDLGAFTSVPLKMGRAARRTVGNLAYGVLTANANMGDGIALFHAGHGNLAGSAGAPSVVSVETAMAAMATQKDRSDNATALNIRPTFIIAPFALQGTVNQLLLSEYDPAKTTRAANTVRNALTPIFDARLDGASTTAWYLSASPSAADTVEISYLDGNDQPFLDSKEGWSRDGVEFKVRMEAAATALAWEGLYKNAGA